MKKTVLLTILLSSALVVSAQQKNTSQSYIEKFKDNAVAIMNKSGIPASIILGIAMHESGNGNSAIAKNLNNQFGMKGSGTSVYYKNNKKVKSAYKTYDSILDSFEDFARVLQEKKKFANLFTGQLAPTDYQGWVKGIQRSGYAADRSWGRQVLALINKYNLNAFDTGKKDTTEMAQAELIPFVKTQQ